MTRMLDNPKGVLWSLVTFVAAGLSKWANDLPFDILTERVFRQKGVAELLEPIKEPKKEDEDDRLGGLELDEVVDLLMVTVPRKVLEEEL